MKKAIVFTGLLIGLLSCNADGNNNSTNSDTLGKSPGAIDEGSQHATGITNQNVISTDTAAMNVEKMSDSTGQKQ